jgi:hypothetical protein
MRVLWQDLGFAVRQFRRVPSLTFSIICTLALGIGSATAVFSVVDAVLLRPLPFAHQDRLFFPDTISRVGYPQPWSLLSFQDTRRQLKTFAALAGYTDYLKINLESPAGPISLQVIRGTDNFFDVFGIKPVLGRTFLAGEEQTGKDNVAVLSYRVWQTQFGGERDILGKVARLDGSPYTIIGVMPSSFRFPISALNAIYTPLHADPHWATNRGSHWMYSIGELKPGVTRAQGQADFTSVLANLGRAYPTPMKVAQSSSCRSLNSRLVPPPGNAIHDVDASQTTYVRPDGIRLPGRKYFYVPGVYLTGIDMRRSYSSGSWVSTLIRSTQSLEIWSKLR